MPGVHRIHLTTLAISSQEQLSSRSLYFAAARPRATRSNGVWQATTLVQNDYSYDNVGNRLSNQVSDSHGVIRTEQYGYDELSRLTKAHFVTSELDCHAGLRLGGSGAGRRLIRRRG